MFGPEELSALYLSAKVGLFATLVCLPFAIALAWYLARYEFRLKFMVEALLQLPMVLPPVVLGYLLLILFGQQGLIGQYLHILGLELERCRAGFNGSRISINGTANPPVFSVNEPAVRTYSRYTWRYTCSGLLQY